VFNKGKEVLETLFWGGGGGGLSSAFVLGGATLMLGYVNLMVSSLRSYPLKCHVLDGLATKHSLWFGMRSNRVYTNVARARRPRRWKN